MGALLLAARPCAFCGQRFWVSKLSLVERQRCCSPHCRSSMPKATKRHLMCVAPDCRESATHCLKTATPMCQAHAVRVKKHGATRAFETPIKYRRSPGPLGRRLATSSVPDGEHRRWTGSFTNNGYPRLAVDGRWLLAHRASYMVHVGAIPPGYDIDHICEQRWCIEPGHLRALTHTEHMRHHFDKRQRTRGGRLLAAVTGAVTP